MTADDGTNAWARIIGPCYTTTSLARALGWTEAKVAQAGETLQLLVLETDEGVTLYPAFQLHDGRVVDGLSDVLAVLLTGTADHWTWAQWLNTALPEEDVPRAIDALLAGRLDEVLHDAWAWRS